MTCEVCYCPAYNFPHRFNGGDCEAVNPKPSTGYESDQCEFCGSHNIKIHPDYIDHINGSEPGFTECYDCHM